MAPQQLPKRSSHGYDAPSLSARLLYGGDDVTRARSVVYDANRLMNWLIKYRVKVLIHGHKHQSFVSQVNCPIQPEDNIMISNLPHIAVVGMGGTGAARCENKCATIHFEQNEMVIEFHRIHSDESAPDSICQVVKILCE